MTQLTWFTTANQNLTADKILEPGEKNPVHSVFTSLPLGKLFFFPF